MITPWRAAENPLDRRAEGAQRQSVVSRIERRLIPFIAEAGRSLESRMAAMFFPRHAVTTKEMIIVIALEWLVMANHPIVQRTDIGTQDFRGQRAMIDRREIVADIMEQTTDHGLVIAAGPQRAGRRLQGMLISIDRIAKIAALQSFKRGQQPVDQAMFVNSEFITDELPFFGRAVCEFREANDGHDHSL